MDSGASHPSEADIDRFHRRAMDAGALVIFSDHLAACEACRTRTLRASGDPGGLLDGLDPLADHVAEDELHAYVTGSIASPRARTIEGHLSACASCAAEIRDLRAFTASRSRTRSGRAFWYAVGGAAAAIVLLVGGLMLRRTGLDAPVLTVNDGAGIVNVDGRGALTGTGPLVDSDRIAVVDALQSGTLVVSPTIKELSGVSGSLMGGSARDSFDVISPVATVVRETAPTFRWTPVVGAAGYTVTIQDQADGTTITSARVTATEWKSEHVLARGRTYKWQVATLVNGREAIAPPSSAPAATFQVLGQASADDLSRIPSSHAVRVVLYARAGLIDDAERELASLAAMNPGAAFIERWDAQLKGARRSARR